MKTTKIQILAASVLLLFISTSCLDELFIEGNGIQRTEKRSDEGFNEIASSGDFEVHVTLGLSYSIEITAESNLLPYISTEVDGKKLKIRTTGIHSLRQTLPIEIYITTPALNGVSISGSGFIETGSFLSDNFYAHISGSGDIITKVNCNKIDANVSGSGILTISGIADYTRFLISGSGKIKSYNLEQNDCDATISGSGDMYVNVASTIDAHISGSGKVFYINYPAIRTSISGSGGVVDKN